MAITINDVNDETKKNVELFNWDHANLGPMVSLEDLTSEALQTLLDGEVSTRKNFSGGYFIQLNGFSVGFVRKVSSGWLATSRFHGELFETDGWESRKRAVEDVLADLADSVNR